MNTVDRLTLAAVDAFDYEQHRQFRKPNLTRIYKWLEPLGNDLMVNTIAVKNRRDGTLAAKVIVQAGVAARWMMVKDVAWMGMAGYVVDWSPEKLGSPKPFNYRGCWAEELYHSKCLFRLNRPVVNPEVLLAVPRFRYCAWSPQCGDILDYLKVYADHPRVELLAKAGAGRFASMPGFVARIEADKRLARFLLDNLEDIRRYHYGADVIGMAYRRGIPLAEAQGRIYDRRQFRGMRLPLAVDATKALAYIRRANIHRYDYATYVRNCETLGLDLADTKVLFPREFKARVKIVQGEIDARRRREQSDLARKMDAQIAAAAARFGRIEKTHGTFRIILPRKSSDFVREGKRLHICLNDGHYATKMARGETVIGFVRRAACPSKAFVAVEFDPRQKRVLQCYGEKNSRPPAPVLAFIKKVFKVRAA